MKPGDVTFENLGINPKELPGSVQVAFIKLFNLIELIVSDNHAKDEEINKLKTEIAHLKGEQGKPDIKGANRRPLGDISSEKERRTASGKRKKGSRNEMLKITETIKVPVDKNSLPMDAVYKGTESVFIQEVVIANKVIEFKKEVWYSPSLRKSYAGILPLGYEGQFGPGVKALILELKNACDMTEPKITELMNSHGIQISEATVHRILSDDKEAYHAEKKDIILAGFQNSLYIHTDDTGSRVNGENWHTHILCSDLFTAYTTENKKDRLTILSILQFGNLRFFLNPEADSLLEYFHIPETALSRLTHIPRNMFFTREEIDKLIPKNLCGKIHHSRILEAMAIAAYHHQTEVPVIPILIADDAPQFKLITKLLGLCWVHDGRLYKKLTPVIPLHKDILDAFLEKYWYFYHQLLKYKRHPTKAAILSRKFDKLFSTQTGYEQLDDRIAKTKAKKQELLLVLKYPFLPLHNNPAELGARRPVRKRDISLQTKTREGTRVLDTFLTIVETAKKLKINVYDYLYDRVSKKYALDSLADVIRKRAAQNPVLTY